MLTPFNSPDDIFNNVTENAVLLVFLDPIIVQTHQLILIKTLSKLDDSLHSKGESLKIVWNIQSIFSDPKILAFWQSYNPQLNVPAFIFTRKNGISIGINILGVQSEQTLENAYFLAKPLF